MQKNRLAKAPNYFSLWMSGGQDQEIIAINSRMEAFVDEMSNTRSLILLQKLEKYPIIPVQCDNPLHVFIQTYTKSPNPEIKEQTNRNHNSYCHIKPIIMEWAHMRIYRDNRIFFQLLK